MIARIFAFGLMSAAAVVSQAATTVPADDVPRVEVRYHDLDLSTEKDAVRLYKRIQGAAKAVCPDASPLDVRAAQVSRRCVSGAIERAVAEVNSAQLARVVSLRSRRV